MYVPLTRVTAWARGRYSLRVCRLCRLSNPRLCFYFLTIMVNNINNFGVINFYENNSTKTNNQSRQSEDIIPVPEHFKHITQKCIDEKRIDAVDAEIRAACKGTAEGLWRTLWNNENLGYVEVEHIDATTLYKDIEERYGKLPYTERNFRHARSKRYDN